MNMSFSNIFYYRHHVAMDTLATGILAVWELVCIKSRTLQPFTSYLVSPRRWLCLYGRGFVFNATTFEGLLSTLKTDRSGNSISLGSHSLEGGRIWDPLEFQLCSFSNPEAWWRWSSALWAVGTCLTQTLLCSGGEVSFGSPACQVIRAPLSSGRTLEIQRLLWQVA